MTEDTETPKVLPGLWREEGGLDGLIRLDVNALTPGMVVVARASEPWQTHPELRWQVWPDLLLADRASGTVNRSKDTVYTLVTSDGTLQRRRHCRNARCRTPRPG